MHERRRVAHLLAGLTGQVDEDLAANTELRVKLAMADSKNRGFEKMPDKPLREVIQRKMNRRRAEGMLGASGNGTV